MIRSVSARAALTDVGDATCALSTGVPLTRKNQGRPPDGGAAPVVLSAASRRFAFSAASLTGYFATSSSSVRRPLSDSPISICELAMLSIASGTVGLSEYVFAVAVPAAVATPAVATPAGATPIEDSLGKIPEAKPYGHAFVISHKFAYRIGSLREAASVREKVLAGGEDLLPFIHRYKLLIEAKDLPFWEKELASYPFVSSPQGDRIYTLEKI